MRWACSQMKVESLENKTIKSAKTVAVNFIEFEFTDGTTAALEVVCINPSLNFYGIEVDIKERLTRD